MRRFIFFMLLFFIPVVGGYSLLSRFIEERVIQQYETVFNEQQVVQARLSVQGIEDHFRRVSTDIQAMANVLLPRYFAGLETDEGLALRFESRRRLNPEVVYWDFFPAESGMGIAAIAGQVGSPVAAEVLTAWVDEYSAAAAASGDYVVPPLLATPEHQWYGVIAPVFVEEAFAGVIGAVVDLHSVMVRYVVPLHVVEYGSAQVLNAQGMVLYSQAAGQIGLDVQSMYTIDQRVVEDVLPDCGFSAQRGTRSCLMISTEDQPPTRYLIAWETTQLGAQAITLLLSAPESAINSSLAVYQTYSLALGGALAVSLLLGASLLYFWQQRRLRRLVDTRTQAFRQAEDRYRLLFENALDVIVVADDDSRFVDVNPQTERITGYSRDELLSMSLLDLVSPRYGERSEQVLQAFLQQGELTDEFEIIRKDGTPVLVEITAKRLRANYNLGIARDITQRVALEDSLRETIRSMLALNNTAISITSVLELDDILARLVMAAEEIFPQALAVTVQLLKPGDDSMITGFASPSAVDTPERVRFRPGKGIAGHAIAQQMVINVSDIHKDDRFIPGAVAPPFISLLVAPMLTAAKTWGTLSIEGKTENAFDDQDEILANLLARQAGAAIENAYLYKSMHRQREVAETLHDIALALTQKLRQEDILALILEQVGRLVPYSAAGIWLNDAENNFRQVAGIGYEHFQKDPDLVWSPDNSRLIKQLFDEAVPVILPDVSKVEAWIWLPEYDWVHSWAAVPILARGTPIGMLCLDNEHVDAYGPEHEAILNALMVQVSIAVENARLFEQVQSQARDLQEQVEAQTAEIRMEQERTRAILQNVDDAVLFIGMDRRVRYVNAAFERIFGWPGDAITGHRVGSFIHEMTPRPVMRQLLAAQRKQRAWRGEVVMLHQDGQPVQVEASSVPLQEPTGDMVGMIASLHLIGAERVLERMKAQFMTLISHELRTPLTNLKLQTHLLRRMIDDPDRRDRHLNALDEQTIRLVVLMEKVLNLTRLIDADTLEVLHPVNLPSLLNNIYVRFSRWAEEAGIALVVEPVSEALPEVCGDEQWLTQACYELLENAMHYTPQDGTVTLRVVNLHRFEREYIGFQVQDTGQGISQEDIIKLNQSFIRVGEQRSGATAGLGVGLFIARSVARRHGGMLIVESALGEGSIFTLCLPVNAAYESG